MLKNFTPVTFKIYSSSNKPFIVTSFFKKKYKFYFIFPINQIDRFMFIVLENLNRYYSFKIVYKGTKYENENYCKVWLYKLDYHI